MYIYGDGLHFVCSYIGVYRSSSYVHQCRYTACRSSRADTHLYQQKDIRLCILYVLTSVYIHRNI